MKLRPFAVIHFPGQKLGTERHDPVYLIQRAEMTPPDSVLRCGTCGWDIDDVLDDPAVHEDHCIAVAPKRRRRIR